MFLSSIFLFIHSFAVMQQMVRTKKVDVITEFCLTLKMHPNPGS